MEVHPFLIQLALILISARVLGEVAARYGIPAVIGELTAGLLLGPGLLGWVEMSDMVHTLAEVGLIMLLFDVGLNTNLENLVKSGGKSFVVALGGFVLPFLLGYALCRFAFDMELIPSMLIGGTLMLVLVRTALAAGIHAVSSATIGGCLGFAYLSKNRWSRTMWSILGLVCGTVIHSGWNLTLLKMRERSPGIVRNNTAVRDMNAVTTTRLAPTARRAPGC